MKKLNKEYKLNLILEKLGLFKIDGKWNIGDGLSYNVEKEVADLKLFIFACLKAQRDEIMKKNNNWRKYISKKDKDGFYRCVYCGEKIEYQGACDICGYKEDKALGKVD